MKVSFISELNTIGYGRTFAVNRLWRKLEEKGIEISLNNGFKDANVIHAHTPLYITLYALDKYKHKKFVGTIHSDPDNFKESYLPMELFTDLGWKYYFHIYSKFDKLVAPTEYLKRSLSKKGFENIEVISNGVDLREIKRNREKEEEFKEKYGFEDFILIVGRINDPRKDIKTAIELSKVLDYNFVYVGSINPISPTSFFQKFVKKMEAPDNFHFLGYLTQREMIGAYSSASLLLHPSLYETEGLAVLEAMACHLPVVVRNIPAYNNFLINGKNSFVCNSFQEFKNAITNLMKSANLRKKVSKNGYKAVQKKSLEKTADKYIKLYEELLNGKS